MKTKKSAFDCKHVNSVRAWALASVKDGKPEMVGRVVADYSDNRNGSVCTVTVVAWGGPMNAWHESGMTAKAGGYGYCKFSAAFEEAVRDHATKAGFVPPDGKWELHGRGEGAVRNFLEKLGYTVLEVI